MKEMGLERREDHPDPEMVTREVRHIMASHIPRAWTHPHVDCATILDHCSYNSQCQIKSTECAGCGSDNKCQADRDSGSADDLLESLGDGKHDSSHGFGRT
jgi:hypothetical protein